MKKFSILLISICAVYLSNAQSSQYTPATIRTPKGSIVSDTGTFVGTDVRLTSNDLAALDYDLRVNYNGAQRIGNPTYKYNCHAYAWYLTEGGNNNVWLGITSRTAHNTYWTDGSYIETLESTATKVVYRGNHTAIRQDSNWYQSKWGSSALVKHHPNDVPSGYLPQTPKRNYKRNTLYVAGINPVGANSNQIYSLVNIPAGVTFNGWTISPGSNGVDWHSNNTNAAQLSIEFETVATYTITAKFVLPSGSTHNESRTINVLPTAPIIVAEGYSPPRRLRRDETVVIHLEQPYPIPPGGNIIEWSVNTSVFAYGPTMVSAVYVPNPYSSQEYFDIRCRMQEYSTKKWTAWSDPVTLMYEPYNGYYAPAIKKMEDVKEYAEGSTAEK